MANVQGKLSSSLLWMTENDAYRWRKWWVDESGVEEKKGFNRKQLQGFALCWFTVRGEFVGIRQTKNITLTFFSPCCLSLPQNSIRHNLSLHSRFIRVQNEGTGKSSWWMLNPEGGKSGKSPRRRAASMDNNSKFAKSRGRAAKKKVKAAH